MDDPQMTSFEVEIASRLRAYSAIDVPESNSLTIARETMATGRRSGIAATWVSLRAPVRAAILLALLGSLLIGAVLVGSQLLREVVTVAVPSPSGTVPSSAPAGPASADLRARWLAIVDSIPAIGNGGGPVALTVDPTGSVLSLSNLAPGASFTSRTSLIGSDQLTLELISPSGGCAAGAEGLYHIAQTSDGARLTFLPVSDVCPGRSLALARTWDRTLLGPTTIGAGVVDSFDPSFFVALPDDRYEARLLADFIEIGGSNGFSLMVFKNPQGFADSCSDAEVRYPYTPGAAAFVEYYRHNDTFTVVEATPLLIDGHDAVHLVTKIRTDGARCTGAPLYALTPKACSCHFLGGDDSFYLVDVGADTFLFQLSPTISSAAELPIIRTIRIPYVPGQQSP